MSQHKWQKWPTPRSPKALAHSPVQNLWDISEIGQGTSLQTLSKRSSGLLGAKQHEPQGKFNLQSVCTAGTREKCDSTISMWLAQSWGWWLWHAPANNPHSGRKLPSHQHYHLLWVWGKSSNISKQWKDSAELLNPDAPTKTHRVRQHFSNRHFCGEVRVKIKM